jgi:hypothetical protein
VASDIGSQGNVVSHEKYGASFNKVTAEGLFRNILRGMDIESRKDVIQ